MEFTRRKKVLFIPIIMLFLLMVNLTLLTKMHDENKVLQQVILDFKNVSRDLYNLHKSMLNMMNADQAFVDTAQIPFLKDFIHSSQQFKANIYSLKQSLVSLPLAYKMLEEVEIVFLKWLNTSYPNIKTYQGNISQSVASQLSQSLDESVRTQAIKEMTEHVAQVKNMWYQHVVTVVKQVNGKTSMIQFISISITLGTVLLLILFSLWVVHTLDKPSKYRDQDEII